MEFRVLDKDGQEWLLSSKDGGFIATKTGKVISIDETPIFFTTSEVKQKLSSGEWRWP